MVDVCICRHWGLWRIWISTIRFSILTKRPLRSRGGITDEDFLEAAKAAGVKPKKAKAIVDQIREAIRNWPTFAAEAEVRDEFVDTISRRLVPVGPH